MSKWGIKVYLSINFAAPITLKELSTADPLDEEVGNWWKERVKFVYDHVPRLGGFMERLDLERKVARDLLKIMEEIMLTVLIC